jgi:hypothetical protein
MDKEDLLELIDKFTDRLDKINHPYLMLIDVDGQGMAVRSHTPAEDLFEMILALMQQDEFFRDLLKAVVMQYQLQRMDARIDIAMAKKKGEVN